MSQGTPTHTIKKLLYIVEKSCYYRDLSATRGDMMSSHGRPGAAIFLQDHNTSRGLVCRYRDDWSVCDVALHMEVDRYGKYD